MIKNNGIGKHLDKDIDLYIDLIEDCIDYPDYDNLDKYVELIEKLTQRQRGGIVFGYERLVVAINKYIQENEINIGAVDIDDLAKLVDDMMQEEEEAYNRQLDEWEVWNDQWCDEQGRR